MNIFFVVVLELVESISCTLHMVCVGKWLVRVQKSKQDHLCNEILKYFAKKRKKKK